MDDKIGNNNNNQTPNNNYHPLYYGSGGLSRDLYHTLLHHKGINFFSIRHGCRNLFVFSLVK